MGICTSLNQLVKEAMDLQERAVVDAIEKKESER